MMNYCYVSGFFPEITTVLCMSCLTWLVTFAYILVYDLSLTLSYINALTYWIFSYGFSSLLETTWPKLNLLLSSYFYCYVFIEGAFTLSILLFDYFLNLFPSLNSWALVGRSLINSCQNSRSNFLLLLKKLASCTATRVTYLNCMSDHILSYEKLL